MFRRKLSHEAKVGIYSVSYCTESEASMVGSRSVVARGASRGVISSRGVGTMTEVIDGRMSSRNGGTIGSPYAFQSHIQMS